MQPNFDSMPATTGSIWKGVNPNDSIQGTLVGKRSVPDTFNPGKEQTAYDIMEESGMITTIFSKGNLPTVMKYVKIGNYVKIIFTGMKAPTRPGQKASYQYITRFDPNMFNEEWLKNNEEAESLAALTNEFNGDKPITDLSALDAFTPVPSRETGSALSGPTTNSVPTPNPVSVQMSIADKFNLIKKLAMEKIPGTSEANIGQNVMMATGIAFIEPKYDEIIQMLS